MRRLSTTFLQAVIVLIGIVTLGLLLWEPTIEGRNVNATLWQIYFNDPFLILVYAGSIPFFIALYQAIKLLGYAAKNMVFSPPAVRALQTIQYCAITIIGFVVAEEAVIIANHGNDDVAGGVFMGVLITFGSIVIAAAAAMFARIVQSAVEMKSEHDFTV